MVTVLRTNEPFVQVMFGAFSVTNSMVRIQNNQIYGFEAPRGVIFECNLPKSLSTAHR